METKGAKVFGLGLSRTGTTSLHAALYALGLRSAHFLSDPQTQREVTRCLRSRCAYLRLSVLEHLDALSDTPVPGTYRALDAAYPGSRFILTVRDRDDWLRSYGAYWRAGLGKYLRDYPEDPLSRYLTAHWRSLCSSIEFDAGAFAQAYDDYHAGVTEFFRDRPGDILSLNIFEGQGWPELCGFLGCAVPAVQFPHENPATGDGASQSFWALRSFHAALEAVVPAGSTVALVDAETGVELPNRRTIRFCGADGEWGNPVDSAAAIARFERFSKQGLEWIVFLSPAFWWFDYYRDFIDYLEDRGAPVRRGPLVAYRIL